MKLKWTTLTPQQDKKSVALTLIVIGLWCLLGGPGLFARWATPGVENFPSFAKTSMQLMIGGGVALIAGAALAWHAWARPKPN